MCEVSTTNILFEKGNYITHSAHTYFKKLTYQRSK